MVVNTSNRKIIRVSNSSRGNFSCKFKWWLSQVEKLVAKKEHAPFTFGSAWHDGQEALDLFGWERGVSEIKKLSDEWLKRAFESADEDVITKVEDQIVILNGMFKNYRKLFEHDVDEWEVLAVEMPFRFGIRRHYKAKGQYPGWRIQLLAHDEKSNFDYEYIGVIDKIIRERKSGLIFIVERKTMAGEVAAYEAKANLSFQKTGYAVAADLIVQKNGWGMKCDGVIYDIARKAYPKLPKTNVCKKCNTAAHRKKGIVAGFNKDGGSCEACSGTGVGGVSTAACDTNYETYIKIFNKYPHIDKSLYQNQIDEYSSLGDNYHHRFHIFVSQKKRMNFLSDLWEFLKDVRRLDSKPKSAHYRCRDWDCDKCWYAELCLEDTQFLRDQLFDVVDSGSWPKEYIENLQKKGLYTEQLEIPFTEKQ